MFTKEQRLEAYQFAKEIQEKDYGADPENGVCFWLRDWLDNRGCSVVWCIGIAKIFPEFFQQKPEDKRIGEYWWNNPLDRIEALSRAILLIKQSND